MTNPEPASRPRRSASYRMISGSTASRQPNVPALLPLRRPRAARLPGRRRARRGIGAGTAAWVTLLLVKIFDHQYGEPFSDQVGVGPRYTGTVPGASTRRLVLPRRSRGRQLVIVTLERDGAKADQAERRSASTART